MPGSSNFQQWNPASANQENDAAYTADSLRSGGATIGAILPSPTFNKLAYQLSTGMAALMQMMANKGYTVSDVTFSTLTSTLANILTTADLLPEYLNVAYSPSLVFDCSKSKGFVCTLTGNATLSFINVLPGSPINVAFIQGSSGGYTLTWPSIMRGQGTIGSSVGSASIQTFWFLSDNLMHAKTPMAVS
jgi:hypothetical protein